MHAGSLLRIPLVADMMRDPITRFAKRNVDAHWQYHGHFATSGAGFNPVEGVVFYPAVSAFAEWILAPQADARPLNHRDRLLREVLLAVHDYLHVWAYRAIVQLAPDLGFTRANITKRNFEAFVFCHLLSEAVATVGLDYWYLATVDLNEVVDLGTALTGLTASYQERHAKEYRRFNSEHDVQRPAFLLQMTEFYCSGVFPGFSVADCQSSPLLLSWLEHELRYARRQREYCRLWFHFLRAGTAHSLDGDPSRPVRCDARWQRALMRQMCDLLWAKVTGAAPLQRFSQVRGKPWRRPLGADLDFRFINFNALNARELSELKPDAASFDYFLQQWMVSHRYDASSAKLTRCFDLLRAEKDDALVRLMTAGLAPLPRSRDDVIRDVFVLG